VDQDSTTPQVHVVTLAVAVVVFVVVAVVWDVKHNDRASWWSDDKVVVVHPPPTTAAPTPTVAPTVPTTGAPTFRTVALTEDSQLTARDGQAWDWFGVSVALQGDTLVVGAGFDDYVIRADSGSVYVYTRSSSSSGATTWTLQAQLKPRDWDRGDQFGRSVAIDGNIIVVGQPDDDDKGIASGSAYVYTRRGTTWTQQAKLTAFDGARGDYFGTSVAIDCNTIVVGADGDEQSGLTGGSAYVYTRTGTTWRKQAKLRASDSGTTRTDSLDDFGRSVAIAGDTIVVGALRDNDNDKGIRNSGSVYVFQRTYSNYLSMDTTWTEQAKLTASDGAAGDEFGRSVAIDGDTIVVGAWLADGSAPCSYQ